jgi:two-component system, chemotaxis family, sensor kinase CheA
MSNDFLNVFLEEAEDILAAWERCCLDLEKGYSDDVCDGLFRAAHNLKGSSRSVGLEEFGTLVHRAEDVIGLVKAKELKVTDELIKMLLSCQETLLKWVEKLYDNETYVPEKDKAKRFAELDAYLKNSHGEPAPKDRNLGEILLEQGDVSRDALAKAVEIQARKLGEVLVEEGVVSPDKVAKALEIQDQERKGKKSDSLRVSADKIDQLMQYIGELSTHLSIIWQSRQAGTLNSDHCKNAIYLCHKIIKDLQDQSLSLRMQPLQGFFQRLERTATDVARSLKKKVEIQIEGEFVELDKTVTEKITDSFVHILRNSVDHGVENPAERLKSGKNETGRVKIAAKQDANMVTISVMDDGKGLDADRIYKKALEKKLITENVKLTEADIHKLILQPGFSTAETVTDISGRGVGMDVVSRAIESVGGNLEIASKKGHGTQFHIHLPTSLSIVDSLIIGLDNVKYAVPIQDLSEIIDLSNYEIKTATQSGRMISLRGNVVPVQDLRSYLATQASRSLTGVKQTPKVVNIDGNRKPALIARVGVLHVAFEVDHIHGQQPVVIRKLQGRLEKMPGISGTTILGDGTPGMIISLPSLARTYLQSVDRRTGTNG